MPIFSRPVPPFLLLLLLAACGPAGDDDSTPPGTPDWPELGAGTLRAGAMDGTLDLPVGIPLGGFTDRDRALGGEPGPDTRDSDYRTDFVPSAGWETRIPAQVLWMEDGERNAILVRCDLIYSFDGLTEELGRVLSERSGLDLADSVFTFTNHSHSSYGAFSKSIMLAFGGDFYRKEVLDRMVGQIADLAMAAWEGRVEAAIGLGIDEQFDPIGEDRIFRDRRGENDGLLGPDGQPTGAGWKDQRATLLRVDSTDGDPIAAWVDFGIHGTVMGGDNAMISSEAGGHVTWLLQQRVGGPVWMFAQGAGGDASPAGFGDGFARMQAIAEVASEKILALYDATVVAPGPVTLEPLQRYVPMGREMVATRGNEVLRYGTYDPTWDDEQNEVYEPDLVIYDADGSIASPIDEFWPQHGAALCGGVDIDVAILGLDIDHPAYKSCLDVKKAYVLFHIGFPEYIPNREAYPLPLPESRSILLGALGLRSMPVTVLGVGTETKDVNFAFAPGEATTLWAQSLRWRSEHERGSAETVVVAYAMDHMGYLLLAEDWLLAGYEPSITVWGPLQGDWILERLSDLVGLGATSVGEDSSWPDWPTSKEYPNWEAAQVEPDDSPLAGTLPTTVPAELWTWDHVLPTEVQPSATIPRMSGIARFTFFGSDPAMGMVNTRLEHEDGAGNWLPVLTPTGHELNDALPDILTAYTPQPLRGQDGNDPVREHYYHVGWQATDTYAGLDRAPSLALGRYRFHVSGLRRDPQDQAFPFDGIPWSLDSAAFEVVPAPIEVEAHEDGADVVISARYAPATGGWRLLSEGWGHDQPWPVQGTVGLSASSAEGGALVTDLGEGTTTGAWREFRVPRSQWTDGSWSLTVTDPWGNSGTGATLSLL